MAGLYHEVHGEGEPLLLIAGLASDSQSWQPVIDRFAEHFQTIVFDNRGVGRSDTPDGPYTIRQMADDAASLLDELHVRSAHVVGHSMGGCIAQEMAIERPERVRRLVLAASAPVASERNKRLFSSFLDRRRQGMSLEIWFQDLFFWLFRPATFRNKEFMDEALRYALDYPYPQSVAGFAMQVEAIAAFDARERLGRIRAETLVVAGEEDILITPGESEELVEGIPNARPLCRLPRAAHSLFIEDPAGFANVVVGFLRG